MGETMYISTFRLRSEAGNTIILVVAGKEDMAYAQMLDYIFEYRKTIEDSYIEMHLVGERYMEQAE